MGRVLIVRAMLSKSLIQFSVDGLGVPSLLFTWGQTMVEVMKIMATSFKGPMHALLHSVPQPCGSPPPTHASAGDLDTHRQVWVSLLRGHCSFLLGPGAYKVLFVPSKSLFPLSWVSSGSSVVELMATSSKTAYAIPRSAAPRAPESAAVHSWTIPPQETLKHSSVSINTEKQEGPTVWYKELY